MKQFVLALVGILIAAGASAHDEGHGPKLSDTGKYGGLVSAVVAKADAGQGAKANLVYKSELVRTADGEARVYIYDTDMKPIDLKTLEAKASASLASKVKGKWKNTEFPLVLKDGAFVGKMSKVASKPYNIDVTFKDNGKELLSAFDNLD